MPLLSESRDDVGEIALACRVDDVGGAGALAAHAHVERSVEAERKTTPRGIELHGRDAKIESHTVDGLVSRLACNRFEIGKTVLGQDQPSLRRLNQVGASRNGALITVDGHYFASGRFQDGARVTAGAEGAVDVNATVTNVEKIDCGAAEHGNMEGWSASDS